MSNYVLANTHAAWYQDNYPGSAMRPNCVVLHTTEGTTLPGYSGGSEAPNYTAVPNWAHKRLDWYAHFPDERSSRALVNAPGGVETNTLNCVQVELVGTCDPRTHQGWAGQGIRHVYWATPPLWALRAVATFAVDMYRRHRVPVSSPAGPTWTPYPDSYGKGPHRFSFEEWKNFNGWCGHQHVPENDHGDPGGFPWGKVEVIAKDILANNGPLPRPTRVTRAHDLFDEGVSLLDAAIKSGRGDALQEARDAIATHVNRLPAR